MALSSSDMPLSSSDMPLSYTLPRYLVLKSVKLGHYLRYVKSDAYMKSHFLLDPNCSIGEACVKFEVQIAKCDKNLVHIRCCYNNKYWVADPKENRWIVAAANEQEEDQSQQSCTLFRPIHPDQGDQKAIQFQHVKLGLYMRIHLSVGSNANDPSSGYLYAGYDFPHPDGAFEIINWETLVILPKYVTFKGHNGKYLRPYSDPGFLTFEGTDIGDVGVGHEIIPVKDGYIRIKCNQKGTFWRRREQDGWIVITDISNASAYYNNTLFWPVKISNNVIALRNLSNKNFCTMYTQHNNCLNADSATISKEAQLVVEELVVSRKIYNVDFHLDDARIYDATVIIMDKGEVTNMTSETIDQEVKLSYKEHMISKFDANVSLKLNYQAEIKAGIPIIEDLFNLSANIKFSAEFEGHYAWGETVESTKDFDKTHKVKVKPNTKVTVCLLATKAACDVPFSYTQHDILTNGEHVIYKMDDGIYTGINCFNFHFKAEERTIESSRPSLLPIQDK